ncbi:MAG TPA: AAA family ATPase, partial [Candidatus Caccomorpha excrementavium]|nr:AAA family ATPase [Candidatus Caccomorpha excrementavium]
MLKIPYDVSGFRDIMNHDYYYIDKTLLIKELSDSQSRLIRLTLPAGFGATLGLGMLEYFFQDTKDSG